MQLYFIRHGQSTNNHFHANPNSGGTRVADPELTEVGVQQAQYVADFLAAQALPGDAPIYDSQNLYGFGITHLYCSLMIRAVATGTSIANALDLPLVGWTDLHEIGGLFVQDPQSGERIGQSGPARTAFNTRYPELLLPDSVTDVGWWNRPFEERAVRPERAQRVLDLLLQKHGDSEDRVAVVSHGGFFAYLMRAILAVPPEIQPRFYMNNTAITRIDFGEDATVSVVYVNRVDFLPHTLLT